jgi:hypothetical protein
MKHHHSNHPRAHSDSAKPAASVMNAPHHEAIAYRAYLLWEARGKPANQEHAIWLEAEGDLVADLHLS